MDRKTLTAVAVLIAAAGLGACQEVPPVQDPEAAAEPELSEPAQPASSAGTPQPPAQPAATCIRGGTSRAEVRAIMGAPDSISFGVWIYGRSDIAFGYGVVVEYTNVDGSLVLC